MKKSVDADLNRISADTKNEFVLETVPKKPDYEIIEGHSGNRARCHPDLTFHKAGKQQYQNHKNRQRDHV